MAIATATMRYKSANVGSDDNAGTEYVVRRLISHADAAAWIAFLSSPTQHLPGWKFQPSRTAATLNANHALGHANGIAFPTDTLPYEPLICCSRSLPAIITPLRYWHA